MELALTVGSFPSEMTAKESGGDQKSELPAEKVQSKDHDVPMQRAGKDEEMAQAVVSTSPTLMHLISELTTAI